MTSSFRKINYSLRPAKHAERRMLCEIFGRLGPFQPVERYIYLGFGSVWFADFILFHRHLGIREMISIERVANARARIEDNKPFRAVTVHYREATRVLPRLKWNRRYFVWLDYDEPLLPEMLIDTRTVADRAPSGTVLAVSVQCHKAREYAAAESEPGGQSGIERFRNEFGRQRVAQKVSEEDLMGWPFGALCRSIIASEIEAALAVRNGPVQGADVLSFRPICEIEYEDGAKMTTIVGLLAAAKDDQFVEACGFDRLDFMPAHGRPVRIRVPNLTVREVRKLEQQLPQLRAGKLELGSIPAAEAKAFADLYRYLPNFAVLET